MAASVKWCRIFSLQQKIILEYVNADITFTDFPIGELMGSNFYGMTLYLF